ncbi:flagellar biosynthesis anti-sigma factor FlgM [Herbaspirillum sp. DW155]|uniref:flagellar biosynthesis anti-sigma factor FlgM n=1 Tax=Herbaspirillum sp. DW155 TaxID=3095609 RepID=UPI003092357B|nr:flagellar biosynthesis anti-sigma factor FlgM [Herbaspirillum sp. DW155]
MNVNDALKSTTLNTEQTQARTNTPAGTAAGNGAGAAPAASDSVRLSSTYQALDVNGSNSSSSFDAQKVADIKAAIANGTFQINPDKIANGVINTAQNLINARQA